MEVGVMHRPPREHGDHRPHRKPEGRAPFSPGGAGGHMASQCLDFGSLASSHNGKDQQKVVLSFDVVVYVFYF